MKIVFKLLLSATQRKHVIQKFARYVGLRIFSDQKFELALGFIQNACARVDDAARQM